MRVDVEPSVRAGPVWLGMSEAEVVTAMGEPEDRSGNLLQVGDRWFWMDGCFQVCFGRSGGVGEVTLFFGGAVEARYAGIDLFTTPADEVIEQLSLLEVGVPMEDGCSYQFAGLRLAFWRQVLPGQARDDDPQDRGGRYWDALSTWTDDYRRDITSAAALYKAQRWPGKGRSSST